MADRALALGAAGLIAAHCRYSAKAPPSSATSATSATSSLSRRGDKYLEDSSLLVTGYRLASADAFDGNTNRSGCINLGTAENKLCWPMLRAKLAEPVCGGGALLPEDALYGDFSGAPHFRAQLAELLTTHMRPSRGALHADQLVLGNGCGSLLEMFAHAVADPGDAVLVPCPYYGGFDVDLCKRAGVVIAPCALKGTDGWALTEAVLEAGLAAWQRKAQEQGRGGVVRALLLTNPHNPTGIAYGATALRAALRFAKRHALHVLVDEIYLLSLFGGGCAARRDAFAPALSLGRAGGGGEDAEEDGDAIDWARVHVLWGFAKDFGASGFRVGVLATYNVALRDALTQLAYFHLVPAPMQRTLSTMLADRPWVTHFIATNQAALRRAQQVLFEGLAPLLDVMVQAPDGSWTARAPAPATAVRGGSCGSGGVRIRAVPAMGGLFTWLDFSDALLSWHDPIEDELQLWKEFIAEGVYLAPGQAFHHTEPGWMRIIFAVPEDVMKVIQPDHACARLHVYHTHVTNAAPTCQRVNAWHRITSSRRRVSWPQFGSGRRAERRTADD